MIFRTLSDESYNSIMSFASGSDKDFSFDFRADSTATYIERIGIQTSSGNPNYININPVNPGESIHFVFSYSSAPDYTCNYFVNGVKYSTQYLSDALSEPLINTSSDKFYVGSGPNFFDGTIDTINMYAGFIEELDQLDSNYTEITDLEIGNVSPDEFYLS